MLVYTYTQASDDIERKSYWSITGGARHYHFRRTRLCKKCVLIIESLTSF